MARNLWPESIAICCVSISTAVVLVPWERVGPINWEAASAIATFSAVVVAIAIPLWQSNRLAKEKKRDQLLVEWWALHDLARAIGEAGKALETERASPGDLSEASLRFLLADLSAIARLDVRNAAGRNSVPAVFSVVQKLIDYKAKSHLTNSSSILLFELRRRLDGAAKLHGLWMAETMTKLMRSGGIPSGK